MTVEAIPPADDAGSEIETSLRDDLRAALHEFSGDEAPASAATPASEQLVEGEARVVEPAAGQQRDATGRFAPKPAEGAAAPAAAPAGEQRAAAPGTAAAPVAPEVGEAPSSWRADAKAKWASLDPEVRAEIQRRERDVSTQIGRMDGERKFGREFADIVRPHMEVIQKFGVTPQFAVQTLLNNDRVMRTGTVEQKVELARNFIRDYGLDPQQLVEAVPVDPRVAQLERQVQQMTQRQGVPQTFNHAPLPGAEGADNIADEIAAFRADPANPHFEAVAPQMVQLLEAGHASDLQDAYQKAVAANPSLRSTPPVPPQPAIVPQPQPAPEAQRQNQASKTLAARRAGASVGSSPGPAGSPAPTSLRDELREQLRKSGFTSG